MGKFHSRNESSVDPGTVPPPAGWNPGAVEAGHPGGHPHTGGVQGAVSQLTPNSRPTVPLLLQVAIHDAMFGPSLESGLGLWETHEPRPWLGWLLVCLLRQIPRQRWLLRVVRDHLPGVHSGEGEVPGLPGWRFAFHGQGCCLESHEGECIDVDFSNDHGLTIDPYFFTRRLFSLRHPPMPESRLLALLPTDPLIVHTIEELRTMGLLGHPHSRHVFRLTPTLECLVRGTGPEVETPEQAVRWASFLGDFEWLQDALQPGGEAYHAKAMAVRRCRREWLEELLGHEQTAPVALRPLVGLMTPQEFLDTCARIIEGPVGHATGETIRHLDMNPQIPLCPAVRHLVDRMDASHDHPFAMHAAASYLLKRNVDVDHVVSVMVMFARVDKVEGFIGNPFVGDFALLALEFAPQHAGELVRRALRSPVPAARMTVAAVLALVDKPWSRRVLLECLDQHTTRVEAVEILAALRRSRAVESRQAAQRWSQAHPRVNQAQHARCTWEDVADANVDGFLAHEMRTRAAWMERVGPGLPDIL